MKMNGERKKKKEIMKVGCNEYDECKWITIKRTGRDEIEITSSYTHTHTDVHIPNLKGFVYEI